MANSKTKQARSKSKAAKKAFKKLIRRYCRSHRLPKSEGQKFADILGEGRVCDTILASDVRARAKCAAFLGLALERLRQSEEDLHFYFWTVITPRGQTSDRIPEIDLKSMRASMDKLLRKYDQGGVFVVETQGLGNYPRQGAGRSLLTAAHAITWSVRPIEIEAIEAHYANSADWVNILEARPVVIKSVTDAPGELDYLAYYILKPPYELKILDGGSSRNRLKGTTKGYPPEFAVRLLEYHSQVELTELFRATAGGTKIRSEALRRLKGWQKSRERWSQGRLPNYFYDDFWHTYRNKKRKKAYEPYRIIR